MNRFAAKFWDCILTIYCKATPAHPGKWRVIDSLASRAQPAWTAPRLTTYNSIRFELDLTDYLARHIYFRDFDPLETRFLNNTIKPGWVAIDAGANVGYYSILLSRLVGTEGLVHAFEPSAHNWQKLAKTIELNHCPPNLRAAKLALSNSCGTISIIDGPAGNSGKTHLGNLDNEKSEIVEQITLDAFANQIHLDRLDFVKVDIEGCEERFIEGATRTFSRFKPLLIIELNPKALEGFGSNVESLMSKLQKFDYEFFTLNRSGLLPLRRLPQGEEYLNVVGMVKKAR